MVDRLCDNRTAGSVFTGLLHVWQSASNKIIVDREPFLCCQLHRSRIKIGLDRPGLDYLHANIERCELVVQRFAKALDRPFRRVIQTVKRKRDTATHRRDINDKSSFLLSEIRDYLAADVHHAKYICLKQPLDLFVGRGFKRADETVAGIVYDGVDPAEFFESGRDGGFDRLGFGHVQREAFDIYDLMQILGFFGRAHGCRHLPVFTLKQLGGLIADARRGSGDQYDFFHIGNVTNLRKFPARPSKSAKMIWLRPDIMTRMKFLHLADVHLGCTRYQLAESPRDFFDAWIDVLRKYAVDEKVDFVLMCGDFFHKRSIPPETMNYAVEGLHLLKDAGIPVITIEGNHDQKHNDSEYSWLRSLANWGLLYLLEPQNIEGRFILNKWDETAFRGGFVDIGRARIFGSHWYGASANWAIPMLTHEIRANRRVGAFHIVMLHTDIEGQETHPIPALSMAALNELKEAADYVALGHTHRRFEIDSWAFNPGSIEITSISDYRETRGVYLVEVSEDNSVRATHIDDYRHRPFQRLTFDVSGRASGEEITSGVIETVQNEAKIAENGKPAPIIEITLRGILGLPNSQLEMKKIRDEAKRLTGALHIRIRNHTVPLDYTGRANLGQDEGREQIERRVVEELVIRDNRYKTRADEIAGLVIGVKRDALNDESPEKIAETIARFV